MSALRNTGIAAALFGLAAGAAAVASNNDKPAAAPAAITEEAAPAAVVMTAPVSGTLTEDGTVVVDAPAQTGDEALPPTPAVYEVPADADTPAETFQVAATGLPVTLSYGRGISPTAAEGAALAVTKRGCPAIAEEGGRPRRVTATTNGQSASFSDPDDAAGWALQHCNPGLNETQPTEQSAASGHPVTLKYGPGVDATRVEFAMNSVIEEGCPTTMESGGRPNRVTGSVNGDSWSSSDPDAVAAWAIGHCNPGLRETQPAEQSAAANGHPVALTYGPGFSPSSANATAGYITDEGCPATAEGGGVVPKRLTVSVNGETAHFSDSSSAAVFALDHCKNDVSEQSAAAAGYPVTLKYGSGVSPSAVQGAVDVTAENGCPASMEDGGIPNTVIGSVNGDSWMDSDPAAVAAWAIGECTKKTAGG